jgi:beta-barrel assembly-enhancing protease
MNLPKRISTTLAASLLMITGCGSNLKPFQSKQQISQLSYDEKLIWHQSDEFEERVVKGKHLYENVELDNYLQGIMDRLYPDYKNTMRVKVFNSPSYNAFALPNGAIYINVGLLAALENEAQVAAVLGHEGAHFLKKHGAIRYQSAQSASVFNVVVAITVPLAAILTMAASTSSMYGYSRDAESESDEIGFKRMIAAGYAPDAAAEAMKKLLQEVKDSGVEEPFFFASHPKLEERIKSFEKLTEKTETENQFLGEEQYQKFIKNLQHDSARSQIEFGRYKSVVSLLKDEERLKRYGGEGHFFIAEAKRMLREADDEEIIGHYQEAISRSPEFMDSHRSLGLLFYKLGKADEAKYHLDYYLHNKTAKDIAHVQFYLDKLN